MKLSELLSRGRPTVSCELFPPKVGTTLDQVEGVLRDTAALRPDFISVTYGAGGSTSKRTQEIAVRLQDTYHVPALAPLTSVSSTREEISSMVAALRAAGIENILALRGDIPRDADFPSPEHYHYASELIGHIRSLEGGKGAVHRRGLLSRGARGMSPPGGRYRFPEAEGGHGGGLPHHPDVL